jgi:hypothetical protein
MAQRVLAFTRCFLSIHELIISCRGSRAYGAEATSHSVRQEERVCASQPVLARHKDLQVVCEQHRYDPNALSQEPLGPSAGFWSRYTILACRTVRNVFEAHLKPDCSGKAVWLIYRKNRKIKAPIVFVAVSELRCTVNWFCQV